MFLDRTDAGHRLAERLKALHLDHPVVLAIPRGGLPVGAVLARELDGELDVVLSRKLRHPWQPELAIGAIAEDGQVYLNPIARDMEEVEADYIERERQHQVEEISRRRGLFRAMRPAAVLTGRDVVVVDDGIATGSTMIAALDSVRGQGARRVVCAAPVAPPERLAEIRAHCDEAVCLETPDPFYAIGQFYRSFEQVEDSRAAEILRESLSPPLAATRGT